MTTSQIKNPKSSGTAQKMEDASNPEKDSNKDLWGVTIGMNNGCKLLRS